MNQPRYIVGPQEWSPSWPQIGSQIGSFFIKRGGGSPFVAVYNYVADGPDRPRVPVDPTADGAQLRDIVSEQCRRDLRHFHA